MRRAGIAFILSTLLASGCSATTADTTTLPEQTTTTSSTTTTASAADTTLPVEGAPPGLTALLVATLEGGEAPGPRELVAVLRRRGALGPMEGAVGRWGEQQVAVLVGDGLVLGAVEDGGGWRWVGGRVGEERVWPSLPAVYAVLGSDARPGEDPARSRADSIHLVALPGDGSADLLGIPRDSWVPIAGGGTSKVNAALALAGPEGMVATLEGMSGVELSGYVLTGFVGFQELVGNVLGGFEMEVAQAFRDRAAGADFQAGRQYFNGPAALAFSRARKAFDSGDFLRQLNGGLVLMGALGAVKAGGPLRIPALLEGSEQWLLTDLPAGELLELALAAADLELTRVTNEVAPGSTSTRGAASVVLLSPAADEMFRRLAGAPPPS